jgi:hypothetical protein
MGISTSLAFDPDAPRAVPPVESPRMMGSGPKSAHSAGLEVRMRSIYLLIAVVGAALPYAAFLPWVAAHGLDARLFFADLFANRISAFFAFDVLVSAVVVLIFVRREGRASRVPMLWLPIAATCLIGVSCGLPLFLYLRERARRA